jgi:HEAT repeat protein/TolA-binding protein
MRILNAALILAAASLSAQEPPRPAQAPRGPLPAAPATPPAPAAAPVAVAAPMPGVWAIVPAPAMPSADWAVPTPPTAAMAPTPAAAPMPPLPLDEFYPIYHEFQGQGRVLSRVEAERIAERAREQAERSRELAREQAERMREQSREQAQHQAEMQREQARMQAEIQREQRNYNYNYNYNFNYAPRPITIGSTLPELPPRSWAQSDPADSLWKAGNDLMQRGDYRKAAAVFKEIPARFKYSQYAVDAMYWQAHALYRVGGNQDLQDALQVLETLKATYPSQRIRGSNADVGALQVRIAGVLSARGMGGSKIVKDALEGNKNVCDSEEIQIRSAAMNALNQTDAASAQDYAVKVLAKKDECSRELRRNAIYLLGNKRDGQFTRTFIDVAKNDPSSDVRRTAIEYLGRVPGDDALAALEELVKTSDDQEIQRSAIRALANNSSPRARNGIKALIERNDVNENQRVSALNSLSAELATTEDVTWLQGLYGKTDSQRVRTAIITAMSRLGGSANEKWFTTLANNENEPIDVRVAAIRQAGQTMDIPALGRLYDQTGQLNLRMEIVRQLGNRREPETIDKLGEILKTGTDPRLRTRAIESLQQKKDERANKLILALIDRP